MTTQSEATLENKLVNQLKSLDYKYIDIKDEEALLLNLKSQLEVFNKTTFTNKEFSAILNHLSKGNIFEKSKTLRDKFCLNKEDGNVVYVQFFDDQEWNKNLYQVTNQVTVEGVYKNRYDVTLLINGLPLVQIELKRRGVELKEAFNQINRYQKHSFWSNSGIFQYVQIFIISNGVNTKYYANNRKQSFKQTFFWADDKNRNIPELTEFTSQFLNSDHLGKMIAQYVVFNETNKILMVLRPYQYYAVENIIKHVKNTSKNGYIWHTTGSGKTLTSFKASQIITKMPDVSKVVFVVDRKDLDYQTMKEFNKFKKDCVDATESTKSLIQQFSDNTKLIVTTIQKLNNSISKKWYQHTMEKFKEQKIVFIFDECHRSQFGETHKRITKFFKNSQLFGFTGTPIFAENALKNEYGKRTTKDLFDTCLHKYVITDAIRDQNVLRFSIEYFGRYKKSSNTFVDIDVEDIDTKEVINSTARFEKIVDHIIKYHDVKTHNRQFSAIFAVNSIENLIRYYELFKKKKDNGETDLRVATIFTYSANEDDMGANGLLPDDKAGAESVNTHTRDKLEEFIKDYNAMYKTGFSTKDSKQFEGYFKDISKRLKEREIEGKPDSERLDILLVVNMFLTGFDAKMINTLYVDKNLHYHGLIQAYSRTNRIINETKSHGNILCFRNLKQATDDAIALFSNKEAKEEIFMPSYNVLLKKFEEAYNQLKSIASEPQSVTDLEKETDKLKFIQAFRNIMRLRNVLNTFTDFSWDNLPMNEQKFEDYKSKYLDLYDEIKGDHEKEKVSILEDVDFELELIHKDDVNVAYILKLLAKLKQANVEDAKKLKKSLLDMLGGNVDLRSKRELIEKFIAENLPLIDDADSIPEEFDKYWQEQKILTLNKICEEENLDQKQFRALIEAYIFNEQEPTRDEVFDCLENRPSVLEAREVGERIIKKMKNFVDIFVKGFVA